MINRRHFFLLSMALAVTACAADTPIAGPVPEVGFQHLAPIVLNVARVEVRAQYQSPLKAPNAEHRLPTSPAKAMRNWAQRRLQAAGESRGGPTGGASTVAEFVIEDAAVIETKLKKTEGLKGFFTYEPTERYDATAVARLTIQDTENRAGGEVRATAKRSIEVSENATLAEREQAWFTLVEALMNDFNSQMENQINGHLARWLETPGLK